MKFTSASQYFVVLFCIFIILLLGSILGYVFRNQLDESMRQQMHDTMIRDYGFVDAVNDAWDALQQTVRFYYVFYPQ